MNIKEFAAAYCQDLLEEAAKRSDLFDLSGFSYDEIITEEDGTKVKVVNTDNYQIPITDILSLDRVGFSKIWPYPDCMEAYDRYMSNIIVLEGEEVIFQIRRALNREQEKIATYDSIPLEYR